MTRLLALFNYRTVIIIIISVISCWLAIRYNIRIHSHLMLYSLIIAFPMVFSLQSAFKRREKALEYMSRFVAGLQTCWQCFLLSKKTSPELKTYAKKVFTRASDAMLDHLSTGQPLIQDVYGYINDLQIFLRENRGEIGGRILLKMSRYMKDVYQSVSYLESQKTHRTMAALRSLSFVSIHLFPLFQAGVLLDVFNHDYPDWTIYPVSIFTTAILITLYNLQRNTENAFDQQGFDDIKINEFRLKLE